MTTGLGPSIRTHAVTALGRGLVRVLVVLVLVGVTVVVEYSVEVTSACRATTGLATAVAASKARVKI